MYHLNIQINCFPLKHKDSVEVMSKSVALALMFDQNKRDLDPSTPLFVLRENSPDFLCMNAMHISSFYLFLASNPGMLQPLPLKQNFVLEVRTLTFQNVEISSC